MRPLIVLDTEALVKSVLVGLALRHGLPLFGWQRIGAARFMILIARKASN